MTIQKLNKPLTCNIANGLNLHNKRVRGLEKLY